MMTGLVGLNPLSLLSAEVVFPHEAAGNWGRDNMSRLLFPAFFDMVFHFVYYSRQ
jgi:hypothetical protein